MSQLLGQGMTALFYSSLDNFPTCHVGDPANNKLCITNINPAISYCGYDFDLSVIR